MKKRMMVFVLAGMMLLSSFGVQAEEPKTGGDGAAPSESQGEEGGEPNESGNDQAAPDEGNGTGAEVPSQGNGTPAEGGRDVAAPIDGGRDSAAPVETGNGAGAPSENGTEAPEAAPSNQDAQASGEGEVTEPITKEDRPYLSLGANLTEEQRDTVLGLMGINPMELSEYDVIYTTIDEEHRYLGEYISAKTIGNQSLSSVLVVKREPGNGINITTKNISYCTIGMYKNALITAGITDADIIVAAPFPVSGTAGLVGAMKAYAVMTGEEVSEESMDAALNELVLTGDLAESVGDSQQVEELIAYLKQLIVENHLETEEEIRAAIDEACEKLDIVLNEEEIQRVVSLLKKISSLDLDLDSIMNQAKDLYDKLSELTADSGFWDKIKAFFQAIIDFFKGLFQ